jgi:hypothetical protein
MSATKRSESLTEKASPPGSHATTDESSFRSISMSFLGKGFDPEPPPGEDVAERAGDGGAMELVDEEVRVMRRVEIPVSERSLGRRVERDVPVLPGDVEGLTAMTPAVTLVPTGSKNVVPQGLDDSTESPKRGGGGSCRALSKFSLSDW